VNLNNKVKKSGSSITPDFCVKTSVWKQFKDMYVYNYIEMEKPIRAFAFTINNYSEDDWSNVISEQVEFGVYAKEIGEEGTPHIQGYFYFKNARSLNAIKKKYPKIHFSLPVKGTPSQNLSYIQGPYINKEGKVKPANPDAVVVGACPQQGQRTDLDEIRSVIRDTGRMSQVVNIATSYQSVKMAEQILKYHEPTRKYTPDFKVYWFWGKTGKGKTKTAEALAESLSPGDWHATQGNGKWWDGYDAHPLVIIDDLRASFCSFDEMLRILQPNRLRIEVKGGTRQLLANTFIITSPYHPENLYRTVEDVTQLTRRITEIRHIE